MRIRFGRAGWTALAVPALWLTPSPAIPVLPLTPDFKSAFLAVGFSPVSPAFAYFSLDSLGGGKLDDNPVLDEPPAESPLRLRSAGPGRFSYDVPDQVGKRAWEILVSGKKLLL